MSLRARIAKLWAAAEARKHDGPLLTRKTTVYIYANATDAQSRIEAAVKAGDRHVVFEPDPTDTNVWARPPDGVID